MCDHENREAAMTTVREGTPERLEQVRVWEHRRKGRIAGVVLRTDDTWTVIRCTEPNWQADVGERLTFRTAFADEITWRVEAVPASGDSQPGARS